MTEEKCTVSISFSLYNKVKEKIKDTEFDSVSSYVEYVLQELLSEEGEADEFNREDEEKIKSRLQMLPFAISLVCSESSLVSINLPPRS